MKWLSLLVIFLLLLPSYSEYAKVWIYDPSGDTRVNGKQMSTSDSSPCGSTNAQNAQSTCSYSYSYSGCDEEGDWKAKVCVYTRYCSKTDTCPNGGSNLGSDLCGCSGNSKYCCEKSECTSQYTIYNINWDSDENDCTCYGKTWFSTVTDGNNGKCCGDDGTNDVFENSGSGNSCCILGGVVSSGSVSSSNRKFKCKDGEIQSCNSGSSYTFDTDYKVNNVHDVWLCTSRGWYKYGVDDDNAEEDTYRGAGWDYGADSADDVCNDGGVGDYGDLCRYYGWSDYGVCAAGGTNGICVRLSTNWVIDDESSGTSDLWDAGSAYYSTSSPPSDTSLNGHYCTGGNVKSAGVPVGTFCADKDPNSGWWETVESAECANNTDDDGDGWVDEFFRWDASEKKCVECDPASHKEAEGGFDSSSKTGVVCESACGASAQCDEGTPWSDVSGGSDTGTYTCSSGKITGICSSTCIYDTGNADVNSLQ